MDEENNDEVYNTPNSVQQPHSNQDELSDTDLNKKHKEFLNAIRTENYDLIDDMIANYQERYNIINRVEPETNQTSIFLAAILNGDENATKISQMLIDNGGNILYKDSYQQTAFFHVAREGKPNLVQLYHDNGANMNEQDNFKQTPLFYAARDGRTDAVRQMCELGSDPNILDQVNENALFYAAREGKIETCKQLLDHGVNVNQVDNKRQTALFFAKKRNHTQVIELQLRNGAINTKDGRLTKLDQNKRATIAKSELKVDDMKSVEKLTTQSHSALNKRKKNDKDDIKQPYRLVYTNPKGESVEYSQKDFEEFKELYPEIANFLSNPLSISPEALDQSNEPDEWFSVVTQIFNAVWKLKGANIFHKPVDTVKLHLPDYFTVVKNPMDLGTIKKKLSHNAYGCAQDFIEDVELVFYNCRTYNGTQSEVGSIGVLCNQEFERLLNSYGVRERFCPERETAENYEATNQVNNMNIESIRPTQNEEALDNDVAPQNEGNYGSMN